MHQLHAEVGVTQLSKVGEELCGDNVEITRTSNATTIVLSDGLGSGVKANILATLTTKIASSMLKRGIPLEDVVDTIAETLPVCRVRKMAYSTLHIITVTDDGLATVVEFDCPPSFLIRNGKVIPFPSKEKLVSGKVINIGQLLLQENDMIVAVSDGVIHAGIGGLLKLGWGWAGVATQLREVCCAEDAARDISSQIISCCEGYYLGRPGDDSTAIVIKVRRPRQLSLFTGPPMDIAKDEMVVKQFLGQKGKKVVSGGTTANIVSRITGQRLVVEMHYCDPQIPPIGYIDGIDLVTEGILTLNSVVERMDNEKKLGNKSQLDGATRLARMLLESDIIKIYAGSAVNPAHHNPNFPFELNIKSQVLKKLITVLESKGKQIHVDWV